MQVHPTLAALTLNLSPRAGEELLIRLPFSRREKGLGDEGKLAGQRCTRLNPRLERLNSL
jgi:hypothetical protein